MTKKRKKAPSIIFQISDGKSSSVKERGNPEMRKRKIKIIFFQVFVNIGVVHLLRKKTSFYLS